MLNGLHLRIVAIGRTDHILNEHLREDLSALEAEMPVVVKVDGAVKTIEIVVYLKSMFIHKLVEVMPVLIRCSQSVIGGHEKIDLDRIRLAKLKYRLEVRMHLITAPFQFHVRPAFIRTIDEETSGTVEDGPALIKQGYQCLFRSPAEIVFHIPRRGYKAEEFPFVRAIKKMFVDQVFFQPGQMIVDRAGEFVLLHTHVMIVDLHQDTIGRISIPQKHLQCKQHFRRREMIVRHADT